MKPFQKISMFCLFILPMIGRTETKEIPFTLDNRDRIIRIEQKVESLDKKIDLKVDGLRTEMNARFETVNQRFDSMDKRFDQLFNFLWAFTGIFTAMMVSVFGFAFWDRKLSLAPIKKENTRTLNALRDYAEHQPKLQEILKNAGLL
ncbi:MAG: hypothetical protein NTX61_14765 [Bacteroidetes bacterium]|nr:hypothetical protein [Bacteroidota bacterium]